MSILLEYGMMMAAPSLEGAGGSAAGPRGDGERWLYRHGKQQVVDQELGVGSSPKEKESTKPNEESDNSTSSNGTTSTVEPEAWSQKCSPNHTCGLCCIPLRPKREQ